MADFLVNGVTIGQALTPPLPDPIGSEWGEEGERDRTHSGALQSMATSTVTVRWRNQFGEAPLTRAQYQALMDAYLSYVQGKVTSITVPDERVGAPIWTTYTQMDSRGIWPRKPTGRFGAHLVFDVEWTFENVKLSDS